MYTLKDWEVIAVVDPYRAPEKSRIMLYGVVYGHPTIEDGHHITTSYVVGVDPENPKTIKTSSGSTYELEQPSEKYTAWCKENNMPLDPDYPIRILTPLHLN